MIGAANVKIEENSHCGLVEENLSRMVMLHEFALILNSTHNIREIIKESARKITEIMQAEGCHILFTKSMNNSLQLETAIHYGEKAFPRGINETQGISGIILKTNHIVLVTDAENDSRVQKEIQQHFGHQSMVGVPILIRGRAIGVLVVYSTQAAKYDYDDGQFLLMLGNHLGLAVENAKLMNELQKAAVMDPLTEAYNYRFFRNELENNLNDSKKAPLSLALVDLNNFKCINDTYGHLVGDYVLQEVTKILKQNVRSRDSVARNGGDEFALILPETDSPEAFRIMQRVEDAVAAHQFKYGDRHISVSISWGAITACGEKAGSIENIINRADRRLYNMKRKKRI